MPFFINLLYCIFLDCGRKMENLGKNANSTQKGTFPLRDLNQKATALTTAPKCNKHISVTSHIYSVLKKTGWIVKALYNLSLLYYNYIFSALGNLILKMRLFLCCGWNGSLRTSSLKSELLTVVTSKSCTFFIFGKKKWLSGSIISS